MLGMETRLAKYRVVRLRKWRRRRNSSKEKASKFDSSNAVPGRVLTWTGEILLIRASITTPASALLRPDQLEALGRWGRYSRTEEFHQWLRAQHVNARRFQRLVGRARSEEDVSTLFKLVWEGQGGRRAVNRRLYESNSLRSFLSALRFLANEKLSLPERVDNFFQLKGTAIWGMSLLLCYVDPYKYPFVAGFMKELLGLDKAQIIRSRARVMNRYPDLRENEVSPETWKYLTFCKIFEEIRNAVSVTSFLGIQDIFWNAWKKSRKSRFRPGRGLSPNEALKRGRFGEYLVWQWERRQGREAHNRADENLGYDIESYAKRGTVRFIEVKNFGGRPIELTDNEEKRAEELGRDYYLYIVYNEEGKYLIRMIRDPVTSCKLITKPSFRHLVKHWMGKGTVVAFTKL